VAEDQVEAQLCTGKRGVCGISARQAVAAAAAV
jgi:hypothetical protein